jgi:glycosyltransferase involved in cell wall biosynthesis
MTRRHPAEPVGVLFVAGADFYSGGERALLVTIRSLDPSRYRPFVAVGTRGEMHRVLESEGIERRVVPLRLTSWTHAPQWAACVLNLAQAGWRQSVQLIHANELSSLQPAGYAARLLGIPALTHIRFPDPGPGYAWFAKPGLTRALFVSEYLKGQAISSAASVFDGRADVLYDGVELPALPESEAWRRGREALNLPVDIPTVVISGQVTEIKGIWEFIEAGRLLNERGVPGLFVVLGDDLRENGRTRREAEQRVRDLNLTSRFRFLGFRPDAPSLIPLFDIVAVPSHIEPLGNATLEAMAASRPVVGANVGGIPEMIVHGETGLLVPTRDARALADALEALLKDPQRRIDMGAAGRRRAAARFSTAAHAERLQGIYDDVLARSEKSRAR